MSGLIDIPIGGRADDEQDEESLATTETTRTTWQDLAPELLIDVVERVQRDKDQRRRVVAMAGVCRSWRRQILAFVRQQPQQLDGVIDFPWCLLQPRPLLHDRDRLGLIRCLLSRKGNRFLLYQTLLAAGQEDSPLVDKHFLLAARRRWRPTGFSYVIGKNPADLTHRYGADTLGHLKSNFWASEFVLWQKQEEAIDDDDEEDEEEEDRGNKSGIPVLSLRFVEHTVNGVWQRRIQCALPHPCRVGGGLRFVVERLRLREERRLLPTSFRSWLLSWSCAAPHAHFKNCSSSGAGAGAARRRRSRRSSMMEIAAAANGGDADAPLPPPAASGIPQVDGGGGGEVANFDDQGCHHLELRSKVPEWDQQQQCWSLDFSGRASLPSMHNFQLVRADNPGSSIVLQVGKIAKNFYTVDFAYPLSPFQAFAVCLSSFASSVGLEP